ncbi:hypothetical protein KNT87_gp027 [Erwinia phage Cronus]|uniref:Uncharacterized protein n=1 Tax=Erwinia phage Cronus TaxID=2163633 RepID=A0A2S1GM58_9CAUD|nr:hypothetical protein KNT87_gp027 [Erwinia phage Cronus]AWD90466.1 hypothetical protein [Erwinia phage Cronus]
MGTWVLILTLMAPGSQIHSIKGLPNNASCESAGEAWKKKVDEAYKPQYSFFQCEYLDK